ERARLIADAQWKQRMDQAGRERQGIKDAKYEIARNMKKRGRPMDQIIEDIGLSAEEVEKL
ncbi:hypothetical protein LQZ19_18740, partial [Treponema primitia]